MAAHSCTSAPRACWCHPKQHSLALRAAPRAALHAGGDLAGNPSAHSHPRVASFPTATRSFNHGTECGAATGSTEAVTQVSPRLGVLGAGQMAFAMLEGWRTAGVVDMATVTASVRSPAKQAALRERLGCRVVGDAILDGGAQEVADQSDIIILGVKPQFMEGVVEALASHIRPHHLVVSVAAGLSVSWFEDRFPAGTSVIRVMPNTPMLVGKGASAVSAGSHTTQEDSEMVQRLMGVLGECSAVAEWQMDAVTGVSGSGPAYMFMAIEALADGGVREGLPRDTALRLAAQTMLGAATMVLETGEHPAVLKDKVTSPAGTTIAGLGALESHGVRAAFMDAVAAAAGRSRELSRDLP